MKLRTHIWFCIALLLSGCYTDDFFQLNKDAFYKLYGNGTEQEAVAMQFAGNGDIYLMGNQYVRNQDSSAVVITRTGPDGNQLWSARHFGKGYSKAKAMLILPGGELLLLAASRSQGQTRMLPVLYRLDTEGNFLAEFLLEPEANNKNISYSRVPEDMMLHGNELFITGNYRNANDEAVEGYVLKVNLFSGTVLDEREIRNSVKTEAKRIFYRNSRLLVMGDTWQGTEELTGSNIFLASFSTQLVPAAFDIEGSAQADSFHKAIQSSVGEYVMLSSESIDGAYNTKTVVRFFSGSLTLRAENRLEFGGAEPQVIEEDEEGNFYIALTTSGERGNTDILLNKIDLNGNVLWDAPKVIGGEGSDRIAQLSVKEGYVYLLKTIDMQNENKLISLSKVRL